MPERSPRERSALGEWGERSPREVDHTTAVWAQNLTAYTNIYSALEDDDDDASELEGDSPHHGEVFPREVLHRLGCDELEMIIVHMHYTPPPPVCTA